MRQSILITLVALAALTASATQNDFESMIETYGYARAGFLGNPSDGYFGKTISFSVRNFRARVLLYPSARLEIKLSKADLPVFENLQDLYETTRWRGYYGGVRIQGAARDAEVYVDGSFAGVVDNYDGAFQSLDLSRLDYGRIERGEPYAERGIL